MANTSIFAAFERFWQHVVVAIGDKADALHAHDDRYYTEAEIDNMMSGAISVDPELNDYSENPVQNKVVNAAISNLSSLVGDAPVSEQINEAIEDHSHSASDIDSGTLAIENGGTDADNSVDALKNLVAGNTGAALPTAGNAGRMFFLPASDVPFAPAGYGLGGYSAVKGIAAIGELDNIKANGKYHITQTSGVLYLEGIAFNSLGLEVIMINANYGTQIAYMLEGYMIKRICSNGTWQAWEWFNPPMVYGTEYRTIERFNGKPVYIKAVRHGALNSGNQTIAHGISNIDEVIGLDVMNSTYGFFSHSSDVHASADRTNVNINSAWNMGGCIYVIKYTK